MTLINQKLMKMDQTLKTAYEWAIEFEMRFSGLENHPEDELGFYTELCTEKTFRALTKIDLKGVTISYGQVHIKSEKYLELRMYTLVPYNLLGIQMGIQHEHSNTDFVVKHIIDATEMDARYIRWAKEWKTSILLNGGTSNEGHKVRQGFRNIMYVGTMQQHLAKLKEANVKVSTFYEPDLNSMLTGISFIVDERVFNRRLYKDFVEIPLDVDVIDSVEIIAWEARNEAKYIDWLEMIGGEQNLFLRDFLKNFALAKG